VGIVIRHYAPLHEVTMYQARCTNCGVTEDEYGDFSCMDSDMVICWVVENGGWFEGSDKLLCPECQRCEVCGSDRAHESDEHLVCEAHEGHDFTEVRM